MAVKTYYEILDIAHDAVEAEIRRAYRIAVQQHHPDQHPDDVASAKRMRHLNAARATLLDPETRRKYDAKLRKRGILPVESVDEPVADGPASEASTANPEEFSFAPEPDIPDLESAPSSGFYSHSFQSESEPQPDYGQAASAARQRTNSRRQRDSRAKFLITLIMVPLGGIAGVSVAILLLWVGFRQDPFGLFQADAKPVAQTPSDTPPKTPLQTRPENRRPLDPPPATNEPKPEPKPEPGPTVNSLGQSFAKLEFPTEPKIKTLAVGLPIHTDRDSVWSKVPVEMNGLQVTQWECLKGRADVNVTSPGYVVMAVSPRWGGGGSGGDWEKELTTEQQLLDDGWVRLTTIEEGTSDPKNPSPWPVFVKQFKGGEKLKLRTEKYLAPRFFFPANNETNTKITPNESGNLPASLTKGLVAYYPFNGNAQDQSGNQFHGAVRDLPLTADRFGNFKSAFFLNGTRSLDVNVPQIPIGNQPRSTSLWVRRIPFPNPNGKVQVIIQWGTRKPGKAYAVYLLKNNVISTSAYITGEITGGVIDENWHHVVSVFDGKKIQIFLDGSLSATSDEIATQTPISPLRLGKEIESQGNWFSGSIDDIRIYNRALSETEVKALYQYEKNGPPNEPISSPTPTSQNNAEIENTINESVTTLRGHTHRVQTVAFYPDGKQIVSGGGYGDPTVRIWNATTGQLTKTLIGHSNHVYGVACTPDGRWIASASHDKTVRLWDPHNDQVRTQKGHTGLVECVAFSPAGDRIASCSIDQTIRIWDTKTGELIDTFTGHSQPVISLAYSSKGDLLASGGHDGIKLWDPATGLLPEPKQLKTGADRTWSVHLNPAGDRLVSGSQDGTVNIYDLQTLVLHKKINAHDDRVLAVKFSPDGQLIASGSDDQTIKIWNAETGALKFTLRGHKNFVESLSFNPTGNRLVSGSADGTLKVWNLSGQPVTTTPTPGTNESGNLPASLTKGLVAYYPFNGNAEDESGKGNHAGNNVGFTSDRFGQQARALRIDKDKQIEFEIDRLPTGNSARTISYWMQFDVEDLAIVPVSYGEPQQRNSCYFLVAKNSFKLFLGDHDGPTKRYEIDTKTVVKPDQWYHLALVHDGISTTTAYVDGQLAARRTDAPYRTSETKLVINYEFKHDKSTGQGVLDDLMIYDRALSPVEIKILYESKRPLPPPPPANAPFDADTAKAHQQAWADYLGMPVEFENSIGLKMRLIPPGQFMMGDDQQHAVTLTRPFYLGIHEVSQREYRKVQNDNPSHQVGPENPVDRVTWDEAVVFCRKLSQLPAERKIDRVYRLPTEAEWEYACRAGTTTDHFFGDDPGAIGDYAWDRNNSDRKTHPVGEKRANPWGFHDMLGNVAEWCSDWKGDYPATGVTDPTGPVSGTARIIRGGSYASGIDGLKSAARPTKPLMIRERYTNRGFRVVLPIPDKYFMSPGNRTSNSVNENNTRREDSGGMAQTPKKDEWVALFNGKTLDGWQGNHCWKIVNNTIVGECSKGNGTKLVSQKTYDDFELQFKFKLDYGNSGLFFRNYRTNDGTIVPFQAEIGFIPNLPMNKGRDFLTGCVNAELKVNHPEHFTADMRENLKKVVQDSINNNEWTKCEISAQGSRIRVRVNGILTVDFHNPKIVDRGKLELQLHGGGTRVWFKDILVKER